MRSVVEGVYTAAAFQDEAERWRATVQACSAAATPSTTLRAVPLPLRVRNRERGVIAVDDTPANLRYQPHFSPLFCLVSQTFSGWK